MNKTLGLLACFLFTTIAVAQVAEFEFRSDFRPSYDNTLSVAQLAELQASKSVVVLDVRLQEDFALNPSLIAGAEYRNPESLPTWISQLDKNKEVVVYCVAGKWVSQKVAHLLSEAGVSVRSLEGGFDAWQAELNDE